MIIEFKKKFFIKYSCLKFSVLSVLFFWGEGGYLFFQIKVIDSKNIF